VGDDKRRRQYVPIGSHVAFSDTGTRLLDKWGPEGLLTWILFLAACKRELRQGVFTYSSEPEGWSKLGATASSFSLEDFFKYTGRLKKTSRTRRGRVVNVSCTNWEAWNERFNKDREAERKSRKRAVITPDKTPDSPPPIEGTFPPLDSEGEGDSEVDSEGEVIAPAIAVPKTAVQALIEATRGMDSTAERRISDYRKQLPDGAFHNALESLRAKRKASGGAGVNEVGYVIGTLKSMVKEGQYERSAA
jgi:hypothetical protein